MSFGGKPYPGRIILDGVTVTGNFNGSMLRKTMEVEYIGPFLSIPPIMPSFTVIVTLPDYVAPAYLAAGAFLFVAMVAFACAVIRRF